MAERPRLVYENQSRPVDRVLLLGRAPTCEVRLQEQHVSRYHAAVVPTPRGCFVTDLLSVNGIQVNGRRVASSFLFDGDVVAVGSTTYTFKDPDGTPDWPARTAVRSAAADEAASVAETHRAEVGPVGARTPDFIQRVLEEDTLKLYPSGTARGKDSAERLLVLFKAARAINSSLAGGEVLERVVDMARQVLDTDRGLLCCAEEGRLVPRVWRPVPEPGLNPYVAYSTSITEACFVSDEPILVADPLKDRRFAGASSVMLLNIRAAMCAPLTHRGKRLGVLYVDKRMEAEGFSRDDLDMLCALAAQAAVALSNLQLYEELKNSLQTIQQQQQALLQSERLAAMGLLSAGVAHEIRNPLTVVINGIDMVLEGIMPPEDANENLKMVLKAAEQIAVVTEGLLGFSRKRAPRSEAFDVGAAVGEIVELARHGLSSSHRTKFAAEPLKAPALVTGDRQHLQQVIMNLVLNAAQAMAPAGGVVTVSFDVTDDHVVLRVADTGPGLPETLRERLFQPFVTAGKENGTGLGLWISRTIVEEMGGTLALAPSSGQGATFEIRLPRVPQGA